MTKALENGKAGLADATQETPSPDTVTGLVEELREESRSLQSVAWSRMDGGQSFSLASIVLDRAADALEAKDRELALAIRDRDEHANYCAEAIEQRQAAEARIAVLEDALRVKDEVAPLQYVKPYGSEFLTKAETIVGEACVWSHHEANGAWFWKLGTIASGTEASEADCKKMLWATYEHRIRTALSNGEPK